jgi:hypothetical protein
MNTKLHRGVNSAMITKRNTRKDVLNVLLLVELDTIRHGGDLNTKEVMEDPNHTSRT